jgi:hypothetical protein
VDKSDLTLGMTLAEAFASFRFKPGDVVMHKTATGQRSPAAMVVLGLNVVWAPGELARSYTGRAVVRSPDGTAAIAGIVEFYEHELDTLPPATDELRRAIGVTVEKIRNLRDEGGPAAPKEG